jgi:hypothetical protein
MPAAGKAEALTRHPQGPQREFWGEEFRGHFIQFGGFTALSFSRSPTTR